MSFNVNKNHTLKEYQEKYGNSNLKVYSKEEVEKDESLLKGKNWWLIGNNYYEVKESSFFLLTWWNSLKSTGKIISGVCVLAVVALIIVLCSCLKSCNGENNNSSETSNSEVSSSEVSSSEVSSSEVSSSEVSSSQVEEVGTVYLTYYDEEDPAVEFTSTLQSIKTNETQWTIQFTITDEVFDWHIAFFVIDGDTWTEIAKSPEHATSELTSYQEVVTLNSDVNLLLYDGQTITVVLYCFMA